MKRGILILVGVAVLLGGGIVHGFWTNRWRPSTELARAKDRLAELPDDVGDWKGTAYLQEADDLAITGAVAHYSRTFTDPATGDEVLIMLLAGKPSRMTVHKPEDCYRAAGYELVGEPVRLTVTPAGQPGADLWMGEFTRDDPSKGSSQLRILWGWFAADRWESPDNPRWAFARRPVLYKLYVIRSVQGAPPIQADPSVRLLGQLLPILTRTLTED